MSIWDKCLRSIFYTIHGNVALYFQGYDLTFLHEYYNKICEYWRWKNRLNIGKISNVFHYFMVNQFSSVIFNLMANHIKVDTLSEQCTVIMDNDSIFVHILRRRVLVIKNLPIEWACYLRITFAKNVYSKRQKG